MRTIERNSVGPAKGVSPGAQVGVAFHTDGLAVSLSTAGGGEITSLGLTLSLQTFLTALTWICSTNKAPSVGWLTVTLGNQNILCRVERVSSDSSCLRLLPVSSKVPTVLRGAIRALGNPAGIATCNRLGH